MEQIDEVESLEGWLGGLLDLAADDIAETFVLITRLGSVDPDLWISRTKRFAQSDQILPEGTCPRGRGQNVPYDKPPAQLNVA